MKFIDEYRDKDTVFRLIENINGMVTRPWNIMEVCGGQTHSIVKNGIDRLLPPLVSLIHGPGCPVCVTSIPIIDTALMIAGRPDVIFCTFGDMMRVPGSTHDLLTVKSQGGDVRMVYSPLDAVKIAMSNPEKEVVFFAVGFETTAPANGMSVKLAQAKGVKNFSLLTAQVVVPPALEAILSSSDCNVHGFLAAGHVCTVMGYWQYDTIVKSYQVPIVVTGFEPVDLLLGIRKVIARLEEGRATVENQYARSVTKMGNIPAQAMIEELFEPVDRDWRGIGVIPNSGLDLRECYRSYDAVHRFGKAEQTVTSVSECISGSVLRGVAKPADCPPFGIRCNPEHPLGAPMVSSEGACSAYYRYRR